MVILDANILIRAVLGKRVREILETHSTRVRFFAPDTAFAEAREHLPGILLKRGIDPEVALAVLAELTVLIGCIDAEIYRPFETAARPRLRKRDEEDWPDSIGITDARRERSDQIFFIRRQGGAVMKSRPSRFARPHVRKRIALLSSDVWLLRLRLGGGFGAFGSVSMRDALQRHGLRSTQLVYVVRQASVADFYSALVQPGAHILERVARVEQTPNLGPGLARLACFRTRSFSRERAETSQIQFIGRRLSHENHYTRHFRSYTENTHKVSEHFGKFQFQVGTKACFRRFQEISESFQFWGGNIMRKGSTDPVVEHKGVVGRASAGAPVFVPTFNSFRWQTKSGVCPPFVCHRFGGPYGAKNL